MQGEMGAVGEEGQSDSAAALLRSQPSPTRWDGRDHIRALTVIAAPIALALLSQMAMGVTDTLMLGRIGADALAAGGLGATLFFTLLYSLQGVTSSVAVLAARAGGEGRTAAIPAAYWSGLAIAAVLTPPFFWLVSEPAPLLRALGEDPALIGGVTAYLRVLRWATPAGLVGIGVVRAFLPAIGLQRLLLWIVPAGVVLNLALNIWFIYGGLGLPAYGMVGSAAASTVSVWASALALIALLHGRRAWRVFVRPCWPRWPVIRELLAIGVPVSVATLVEATLFMVTSLLIGELGPVPLAAHMVALNVSTVTFMVPMAIGQAANVRVGYESGADDHRAARQAGFAAIGMAACFMTVTAAAMLLMPRSIVALYLGAGSTAAPLAARLLQIAGAYQIFDGIQVAASGALRGLKDTRVPMAFAVIGYWVIGFWLGRSLAFRGHMGAVGLWWGLCVGLAVVAIAMTLRFAWAPRGGLSSERPPAPPHPA